MPTPDKPTLDYSYSAFQQAQGDNSFPGTQLDNDLANLKQAIDETIDFTGRVVRSDGALQNGIVTQASLSSELQIGVRPPTPWLTGTAYALNDTVTTENGLYACLAAHTAGTFATDLAAGRWALLFELTSLATPADGSITTAKLDDEAVTTAKLDDGSVTAAKLAPGLPLLFVGAELECSGPFAPAGWLFKFGQTLSRVTYSELLAFLTANVVAVVTSGSPTITGVSVDLRNIGLVGSPIEGPGIPLGATVTAIGASTITLSTNATGSNSSASVRIFPHGNGDGSTTFRLPDDRDRASIGRGDMGGTAASRVTASGAGNPGLLTTRLGAAGGVDRHTLTDVQAPILFGEAASNGAHAHPYVDSTAAASVNVLTDPGGAPILQGASAVDRNTGGAGAHTHVVTVNPAGGQAHPNVQPSRVANKIIYTGVL